jgi:hypothetical protein
VNSWTITGNGFCHVKNIAIFGQRGHKADEKIKFVPKIRASKTVIL